MANNQIDRALIVHACAKINLTLRVTGVRADGYHGLRTVFQSLALHDTLTLLRTRGPFRIECDDPARPADRTNLVWRAAAMLWRAAGRRGGMRGVTVRIAKRIPLRSGLGGGSSDAAAAIRGLTRLWRVALPREAARGIAARIGADVPFFLDGGTALGLERGDLLFPLAEGSRAWVTLVIPAFGVSTKDAYGWFDADALAAARARGSGRALAIRGRERGRPGGERTSKRGFAGALPRGERRNDLQAPVAARHPEIARIVRALQRGGAGYAAMSGSGSAVFGMFSTRIMAVRAARALAADGRRTLVTRTLGRDAYAALSAPGARSERAFPLAAKTRHRIHLPFVPRGAGHS